MKNQVLMYLKKKGVKYQQPFRAKIKLRSAYFHSTVLSVNHILADRR